MDKDKFEWIGYLLLFLAAVLFGMSFDFLTSVILMSSEFLVTLAIIFIFFYKPNKKL